MPADNEKHDIRDYHLLPEGAPYQLIEGELVRTPTPPVIHQVVSGNLLSRLMNSVKTSGAGLVLHWVGVFIDDENAFQPDLVFVSKQRRDLVKDDGIHGAPDMVIEILSPSTAYYDLKKKYRVYEKSGVKEYWIVDPEMKAVELYSLTEQGKFALTAAVSEQGVVKSCVLAGFEMTLEEVFLA